MYCWLRFPALDSSDVTRQTRSQRATYQKTAQQWEKEKKQMSSDYSQLKSKVDHLSEEVCAFLLATRRCMLTPCAPPDCTGETPRSSPIVPASRSPDLRGPYSRLTRRANRGEFCADFYARMGQKTSPSQWRLALHEEEYERQPRAC